MTSRQQQSKGSVRSWSDINNKDIGHFFDRRDASTSDIRLIQAHLAIHERFEQSVHVRERRRSMMDRMDG